MARTKNTVRQGGPDSNANKRKPGNGKTPAGRKKKKGQASSEGATAPTAPPQNNTQLWKSEVERVGFEFSKKSTRWKQIMSVIRLVGKHCGYNDEEDIIQLLNPMNDSECQRKKPENLQWDLSQVMKFNIQNGTIGIAHNQMKNEYNKVREQLSKRLDKGHVAEDLEPMAKWRDLAEAWQQGAAYVTAFAKCHPEMSKEMAFQQAVELAQKNYSTINSGRAMIEDLMRQRRLKMSYEAMEQVFYQTKKVPHPKWPRDKEKTTEFVVCKTIPAEKKAGKVICEFFDARGIPYSDGVDLPFSELREWAINDGKADHPDDKERFTQGVLNVWSNFLTIEESKDPPFPTPTKKQQLELSYGCPDDAHFRFLIDPDGEKPTIEGTDMPRFKDVDSFVEFLQEKKFPEQWCMHSEGLKEHRKKSAITALKETRETAKTQKVVKKNVPDLLKVVPMTVTREVKRKLDNRMVNREFSPWYRWELPEQQGIALLEAIIQTKLPNILEGIIEDVDPENEDPFQEIKDKYEERFQNTKHYKSIFKLKDECEECLKAFNFPPSEYFENINYSGGNWKEAWAKMLEYIGLHGKIQLELKALEKVHRTWMYRKPKLIKEASSQLSDEASATSGEEPLPRYEPPGDKFRMSKNYLAGALIGMAFTTVGLLDNQVELGIDDDEDWNNHVLIACNVLGFHDANKMGATLTHYNQALHSWLKKEFKTNIQWAMVMFVVYAMRRLEDKSELSESETEFVVAYKKQIDRVSSSLSPAIKRALEELKKSLPDEDKDDTTKDTTQGPETQDKDTDDTTKDTTTQEPGTQDKDTDTTTKDTETHPAGSEGLSAGENDRPRADGGTGTSDPHVIPATPRTNK